MFSATSSKLVTRVAPARPAIAPCSDKLILPHLPQGSKGGNHRERPCKSGGEKTGRSLVRRRLLERNAQSAGEILHVLPGNPAGTRAAGGRPFQRFAVQVFRAGRDAPVADIALDHR